MKMCGCKEPCFENGECWGHLQGVMCKYLGTETKENVCSKTMEDVTAYLTKDEHDKLKGGNNED